MGQICSWDVALIAHNMGKFRSGLKCDPVRERDQMLMPELTDLGQGTLSMCEGVAGMAVQRPSRFMRSMLSACHSFSTVTAGTAATLCCTAGSQGGSEGSSALH